MKCKGAEITHRLSLAKMRAHKAGYSKYICRFDDTYLLEH